MQERVGKNQLDRRVAELLGKRVKDVSLITQAFLHEAVKALADEGSVCFDGLGRMRVVCRRGTRPQVSELTNARKRDGTRNKTRVEVRRKYYVTFKRAHPLREALKQRFGKEKVMEKFGVDENVDQESLEKKAAQGCPKCGSKVEKHGKVLLCPNCGSAPFEGSK